MTLEGSSNSNVRRGRIMQALIDCCETAEGIADEVDLPLATVKRDLLRLHHRGIIAPIGNRSIDARAAETVWQLTDHGRFHFDEHPGCEACAMRRRLLLRLAPSEWINPPQPDA